MKKQQNCEYMSKNNVAKSWCTGGIRLETTKSVI